MTISSELRTAGPFTGTGALSTYSFAFKVFQASDLLVVRQLISTGAQTTLALTTDYTVSLNADQDSSPGGSITLVAGALATTYTLLITSDVGNLQPTSLTNQGGFYPEVINDSLDRATIQIQQVAVKSGREVSAPLIDGTIDMTLPSAANRASKFLYFDSNGLPSAAAGTNTGNNTSPVNLTLTANNANSGTGRDVIFYDYTTETMRVLGSGTSSKVGIGTANPNVKLHVHESVSATGAIQLTTTGTGSGATDGLSLGVTSAISSVWNYENTPLAFGTNGAERMRILPAGQLCIGSTAVLYNTDKVCVSYAGGVSEYGMGFRPATSTLTTATTVMIFEQSTGTVLGSISHPTSGGTTYNTTSDYRLKANVTPMSGALDRIDALKPCNYTWIDSGIASEGFIAHELQEVIPQAVSGTKDEVDDQGNIRAQGVDNSRVVPTLTAAIKELKAIVEAQAARIAALEAGA